ncbi:TPA: glycosyltransferase [Vibrio vulnificus]|nr:glycosyltransferase [Vibrio vulnificus]
MNKKIYINFPINGGVKQFSEKLQSKFNKNSDMKFCYLGLSKLSKLKIFKYFFYKNVWFSNNNIFIYLFIPFYLFKVSIILHDHKVRDNSSFKEKILNFLFRMFRFRFDKIIIHQNIGPDAERLLTYSNVIYRYMPPHGFNIIPTCNHDYNYERVKILCFGRIEEYKNLEFFAEAISGTEGIQLTIAGSGHVSEKLRILEKCDNIQIINRYIDDNEVVELISDTDFLALPYKSITQTTLIDMSGAYHKPVILSNIKEFDSYKNKNHVVIIDILSLERTKNTLLELNELDSDVYKDMCSSSYNSFLEAEGFWDEYVEEIQ